MQSVQCKPPEFAPITPNFSQAIRSATTFVQEVAILTGWAKTTSPPFASLIVVDSMKNRLSPDWWEAARVNVCLVYVVLVESSYYFGVCLVATGPQYIILKVRNVCNGECVGVWRRSTRWCNQAHRAHQALVSILRDTQHSTQTIHKSQTHDDETGNAATTLCQFFGWCTTMKFRTSTRRALVVWCFVCRLCGLAQVSSRVGTFSQEVETAHTHTQEDRDDRDFRPSVGLMMRCKEKTATKWTILRCLVVSPICHFCDKVRAMRRRFTRFG